MARSRRYGLSAVQEETGGTEDLVGVQVLHATVMQERTRALLTGSAIEFELEMDAPLIERFAPGLVRGPEQRHDRHVEGGGEVSRSRISSHQEITMADGSLGQTQTRGLVRQAQD